MTTRTTNAPNRSRRRGATLSLVGVLAVIAVGAHTTVGRGPTQPSKHPQPAQTTCVPPPKAKTCNPQPKLYVVLVKWSGLNSEPEGPIIKVTPEPLIADSAPVIDKGRWVAITTANPHAASRFAVTVGVSPKTPLHDIYRARTDCSVFPFNGTQITLKAAEASIVGSTPVITGTGLDVARCLVPR